MATGRFTPLSGPPPNKALQLPSAAQAFRATPPRARWRSQVGSCPLAAGPRGLPSRSAALAAERRSVRQRSQVVHPSRDQESCWLGGGVSLPGFLAWCSHRSLAGHLQRRALGRFAASSGPATQPAGCAKGRRRDGCCAHWSVPVFAGAKRFPLRGFARKYVRSQAPAVRRRLGQRKGRGLLGGSRRSEALCLTRWDEKASLLNAVP
jgi:hypothetical protein